MKNITCKSPKEVDENHLELNTISENFSGFLKVSDINTVSEISYSFKVFDLKGNCLLFIAYYYY